ncbi:translation initiation factor IF-2 [bacterium (Candidatus Gribaldobacteria) CG_4_10_14_0_2_um_filter_33_15]|nr:MAG: translation initiation factor IF-2 [bacterium (Candidatus Gribaldobacteria) CG_4_10_14_0_2_um_filter_33_15]
MIQEKQNLTRLHGQVTRPPVVVILGHVDHGKTSILDFIRKAHVAERETGGITQHIGAYEIEHPSTGSRQGGKITFLDTPGHEAFSAMRSRGAKIADIAILVVAADEGVKTQTKEAISTIKKAGIPMIVAINKIDKSNIDIKKVERELSVKEVLLESQGGKVPAVKISAKTGQGIEELLEMIILVAEMEGLKTDISKPVKGTVIEASLDSKKGPIATIILSEGTLKIGEIIGTHFSFGKIKSMTDFSSKQIKIGFPSQPVVVFGFEKPPMVGEKIKVFQSFEEAKKEIKEEKRILPVFFVEKDKKVLNIILKADVLGSLEAIKEALFNLSQEKIILRILKSGVGNIDISDIKLAEDGKAKIFGFRVKTDSAAKSLIDKMKIKPKIFEIIYELIQAVRETMEKMVEPEILKKEIGKVKILTIFKVAQRQIIGGKVIEGEIEKGKECEVIRNEELIGKGKILNLQRNKKEVENISRGNECGILFEGEIKIKEEDILVIYTNV